MLRKLFAWEAWDTDNFQYRRSEIFLGFHTGKLILCLGYCNFGFFGLFVHVNDIMCSTKYLFR
jgi:hypothetical protein